MAVLMMCVHLVKEAQRWMRWHSLVPSVGLE